MSAKMTAPTAGLPKAIANRPNRKHDRRCFLRIFGASTTGVTRSLARPEPPAVMCDRSAKRLPAPFRSCRCCGSGKKPPAIGRMDQKPVRVIGARGRGRRRHATSGAVPGPEKRGNGMGPRPPASEMRQTSRRPSTSITIAGSRNRVEAAAAIRPPSMLTANGTRNRSSSLRS